MSIFKVYLLVLLWSVSLADDTCSATDETLCRSSKYLEGLDAILCSNTDNEKRLSESLKTYVQCRSSSPTFLFENIKIPALPEGLFNTYKGMIRLIMKNVEMPFLASPLKNGTPLASLHTLKKLILDNVTYLHNWKWSDIKLRYLHSVTITNSRFLVIPRNFAKGFLDLQYLTITNSKVQLIAPEAITFANGDGNMLDMQGNELTSLSGNIFMESKIMLQTMDFSRNQISTISGDFLERLTKLKEFHLEGNKLMTLSADLIDSVCKNFLLDCEPCELFLKDTLLEADKCEDFTCNYDDLCS